MKFHFRDTISGGVVVMFGGTIEVTGNGVHGNGVHANIEHTCTHVRIT